MTNQKFISCCGPGEWVVCNCLSERNPCLSLIQAESTSESDETDELANPSDTA